MISREDEIGRLMTKCISCGKCTPYCPSSAFGGLDPHELMVSGEGDPNDCFQCGTCSRICRRSDPFRVIRMMLADGPADHTSDSILSGEGDTVIIPGCTVRERIPRLIDSTSEALSSLGYGCSVLDGDVCCLRPARYSIMTDLERRSAVAEELRPAEGRRKVTPCPECSEEYGSDVENILELLLESKDGLPKTEDRMRVTVYTGCALSSRKKDIGNLVSSMGLEVAFVSAGCCGRDSGREEPMIERLRECDGSSYAITFCPRCTVNFEGILPVLHITELISSLFRGTLSENAAYSCPHGGRGLAKDMTRW